MKLRLPIPVSVNALYFNHRLRKGNSLRGRGKTKKYKSWLAEADKWLLMQKGDIQKVSGECSIEIFVPKTRSDPSNLVKCPQDFLVSRELTDDDKLHTKVSVEVVPGLDCCEIIITPRNKS